MRDLLNMQIANRVSFHILKLLTLIIINYGHALNTNL
jgi:hypothetical protein